MFKITTIIVSSLLAISGTFAQPIDVWVPDTSADTGATVIVPIMVGDVTGRDVIGCDIVLGWDATWLTADSAYLGSVVPGGWSSAFNFLTDSVKIAMAGSSPLVGSGSLVWIRFRFATSAPPGDSTTIHFARCDFNEGSVETNPMDGIFHVTGVPPVIHDVGVTSINAPIGTIIEGTLVTPSVMVENFGTETETFDVTFMFGAYIDTQTVTDLASGATTTVNFTDWTAVVGSYNTMSFTMLVGDEDMSNDTAYGSFEVVEEEVHDVGVTTINAPIGTITEGTLVTPSVTVENFGTETETFDVVFMFGAYIDTQTVTDLASGATTTVSFTDWTAVVGSYNTMSFTMLVGDEDMSNDTAYGSFEVVEEVHDVGVNEIIAPIGIITEGSTVTPTAVVENFGTETETFAVVFDFASIVYQTTVPPASVLGVQNVAKVNIAQFHTDEVYTDTLIITLAAGEIDSIEFTPWTAAIGTYEEMSYSLLDGDENRTNDTAYGRFEVVTAGIHDVGVLEILEPLDTIDAGSTVTPTAIVKNFGGFYENFWVFFNIGCAYSDFRYIGLAAGEVDTVAFNSWLAVAGYYNEEVATYLDNDENPENNAFDEWLLVIEPSEPITGDKIPIEFKLFKPYPNPTVNNLTISYALPQNSPVELVIFDVNGREVKRLISETKAPGYYQMNSDLRGLGNGIYLVRMNADNYRMIEKFVISK